MSGVEFKKSYLLVQIAQEFFAFDVENTIEVEHDQSITFVPNAPQYVKGVVNFRGDILPVIDIREKMYKKVKVGEHVTIILSVKQNNRTVNYCVLVDKVIGVVAIKDADLTSLPEMDLSYPKEFVASMFKRNDDYVFVLNESVLVDV